jgi:peptide/nickel transport system ATP-binding protein/oligopeptide transport system ATP-binding protein
MALLIVENLTVAFPTGAARTLAPVVRNVSFSLAEKETLGLVGESGCGKSVTSLALMGLLETPPAQVSAHRLTFASEELSTLSPRRRRELRGAKMAMIFQEPMTSLNPVFTIGDQLREAYLAHFGAAENEAASRAIAALTETRIPDPEHLVNCYPHELSGGMKQRVMIAMALICRPALLIADEPTTALDVTVQAQILDLLREIRTQHAMAMLFITHNLGVVAELADRVGVMYAGRIVEIAAAEKIFAAPQHPYTIALHRSIPQTSGTREKLYNLPGTVPSPDQLPSGCKFAPRCEFCQAQCRTVEPELHACGAEHLVACWRDLKK